MPKPDPRALFENRYKARELERVKAGRPSPEQIGRVEARQIIKRERERIAALERQWASS